MAKPQKTHTKYIFVTGGVVSSLGKGIASASLGALLENRGLKITIQKLDPYINVDPGTMNPIQHGEVFVTDDGAETDLDLGHYERFTSVRLSKTNNYTTGKIYHSVIEKERRGEYLGRTVQVIPHITDEIKSCIAKASQDVDVAIIEIGGTVGDIESLPFLEAIRQFQGDVGSENVIYIHLTLIPHIDTAGELKTKPTQHSVQKLREIGIQPDILLCRCDREVSDDLRKKISLFCNIDADSVFAARDVESIYEVPLCYHTEGVDEKVVQKLNIWSAQPHLEAWEDLAARVKSPEHTVNIGVVGKYVTFADSYKSLNESLRHGGLANNADVKLHLIDAEQLENEGGDALLADVDAILVPGGFGERGIQGKINATRYARENKIPFFGICLGLHAAIIEFSRNVCGLTDAHSREFSEKTAHPVIDLMEEQKAITNMGATMRLGAYPCTLTKDSNALAAYGSTEISERHRHRYEVNNDYLEQLKEHGMIPTGTFTKGNLVEIVEIPDHPWFLACQFHPEFKSRPMEPHPLFSKFIAAGLAYAKQRDWTARKDDKSDGKAVADAKSAAASS